MKKRKKRIDPINPYTGNVWLLAILENISNGFTRLPKNMGQTIRKPSRKKAPKG